MLANIWGKQMICASVTQPAGQLQDTSMYATPKLVFAQLRVHELSVYAVKPNINQTCQKWKSRALLSTFDDVQSLGWKVLCSCSIWKVQTEATDFALKPSQHLHWQPDREVPSTSHSLVPNCLRIKTSRFFPSTRQPRCLAKPTSRKSHRQKGLRYLSATRLWCQVTQSSSWCPGPEKFAHCCRWYSRNHATLWDQKGMFPQDGFQCFYIQTQFESTPLFQTQGHKWLWGDCLGCGTKVGRDDVVWKDFLKSAS